MKKSKDVKTLEVIVKQPTPVLSEEDRKIINDVKSAIETQHTFQDFTPQQIQLIKTQIAPGATDDELLLFLHVCKRTGLDPFARQIFMVKRWDTKTGTEKMVVQAGVDGFRATAERTNAYAGNDDPIFEGEEKLIVKDKEIKHPLKATATVYKIVKGGRYPFTATARWTEYYPGEKIGFQWHKMPYLMLGKCAEALALRKTFPNVLSGVYANEEMQQADDPRAKRIAKLKEIVEKSTPAELKDLRLKLEKSTKYTAPQKVELYDIIDEKLNHAPKKILKLQPAENVGAVA